MTPSLPDDAAEAAGAGAPQAEPAGTLPLLPTRELVVFPKMVAPIFVGREKSILAIETAFRQETPLVLSAQHDGSQEDPGPDDIMPVGTRVGVLQLYKLPDGSVKALVEGQARVRIERFESTEPYFLVSATPLVPADRAIGRCRSLARRVAFEFADYVQLNPQLADEVQHLVSQTDDPEEIADVVAAHLQIDTDAKQALLEMESTQERLLALIEALAEENAVLGLEHEIVSKVQQRIETAQRQLFLHEKLRVIRDEIEETGESSDEDTAEYARKLADGRLSPAARKLVERELRKLRQASPMSPEVAVIRGLLDTVFDLPWGRLAPANVDVATVARHLERTHYGLKDVKDRILEYLAVCEMRAAAHAALSGPASAAGRVEGADHPATILCLAGPPGTGKSSVAQSIADALDRPFARIALGGVRDEAEIRGHRRTYIGAMPGRILEGLAKAGVDNPVMLLDEIDKLDSDWRGNPAAALMEVLDPAHNTSFRDNYLECEYDLSRVFFIATANDIEGIPHTLYDRLEVIHLSGYTLAEKLAIARRHLLPRTARDSGLGRGDVKLGRGVLRTVVRGYTREAGVRDLERALRRIERKVARKHLEDGVPLPLTVETDDLRAYLGEAIWLDVELPRAASVGESLGLAYTSDGGEVLTVEAIIARGRGELVLTGQLGDVMQESASAAWGHLLANVESDPALRKLLDSLALPHQGRTRPGLPGRSRPRARGCGAEGRALRRSGPRRGDALGARARAREAACRDDRRDHARAAASFASAASRRSSLRPRAAVSIRCCCRGATAAPSPSCRRTWSAGSHLSTWTSSRTRLPHVFGRRRRPAPPDVASRLHRESSGGE